MTRRHPHHLATRLAYASLHTGVTLWHRLPMLGWPGHQAEVQRMVSEKAGAVVEGMFSAQREALRLMTAAMTGQLAFADMLNVSTSIATAGLRPALRTVKANSRRLSRR